MAKFFHVGTRVTAAVALLTAALTSSTAQAVSNPQLQVPPGFVVTQYANIGGAGTSLDFGVDTRDPKAPQRLYVADYLDGEIVVFDDIAGTGSAGEVFADGFSSPLGVFSAPDGSVYVADSTTKNGPFGQRTYGRVSRVRDTDKDGIADKKTVIIDDLPNGRHNTNGMALGPDGMLYVTNGNSTDDGVEGGQPEVKPWSGALIRVDPKARNLSITTLPKRKTLVASGMRNIYDVVFSPFDPTHAWIPMNGLDDARPAEEEGDEAGRENSDDLLYLADIDDRRNGRLRLENFEFPSCLYNVAKKGNLKPYDNPHPEVIKEFGPCPKKTVPRPKSSFGLHTSSDGAAFQLSKAWGPDYRNDLFVAEFGNLFGTEPRGHDVIQVELNETGTKVTNQIVFTVGGTPLDLTFDPQGNMYLLDFTGEIVKIAKV